jgi:hypothetical protein
MQPVVDFIHELVFGVEALGTEPDLRLGEDSKRLAPGQDCKKGG